MSFSRQVARIARSTIGGYSRRMRFLTPCILAGMTAWIWYYNGSETDSKLVFPFVDLLVPSAAGDPARMAELSLQLAIGITVIAWGLALVGTLRDARARAALAEADEED